MKFGLELFEGLDLVETKLCGICNINLPVTLFGREGKGKNGYLRYECKNCAKKQSKLIARIKKTAPKVKDDHKCPICDIDAMQLTTYGKNKKSVWVADHDHKTENFRGWLCHKCNLGLGNLGDNPDRCIKAAEYLSK